LTGAGGAAAWPFEQISCSPPVPPGEYAAGFGRGHFERRLKIERKSQRVFQSHQHVNREPANLAFKADG
jgi:hypothetical protein